jgi:shikimate dehydrogenase
MTAEPRPPVPWAEVIGDPVAQSKSPLIHGFWLERLGLAGRYQRCHVTGDGLAAYLAARRGDPSWRGCNVTIPHKQAVIPLLDAIDPVAAAIGAVNTVVRDGDRLIGYNSDAPGFLEPLRPLLARAWLFRMARVIGAGGAARAIVHALAAEGFTTVVYARDPAKAAALQPDPALVASIDALGDPLDFAWDDRSGVLDLVVNTTPLGMTGQAPLAIDFSHVPPGAILYDIVYAPLETELLAEARARGHATIDGLAMLIGQAAVAFEHFFGRRAPRDGDGLGDGDATLRALLTA